MKRYKLRHLDFEDIDHIRKVFPAINPTASIDAFAITNMKNEVVAYFAYEVCKVNEESVMRGHIMSLPSRRGVATARGIVEVYRRDIVKMAKDAGFSKIIADCPAEHQTVRKLFEACGLFTQTVVLGTHIL